MRSKASQWASLRTTPSGQSAQVQGTSRQDGASSSRSSYQHLTHSRGSVREASFDEPGISRCGPDLPPGPPAPHAAGHPAPVNAPSPCILAPTSDPRSVPQLSADFSRASSAATIPQNTAPPRPHAAVDGTACIIPNPCLFRDTPLPGPNPMHKPSCTRQAEPDNNHAGTPHSTRKPPIKRSRESTSSSSDSSPRSRSTSQAKATSGPPKLFLDLFAGQHAPLTKAMAQLSADCFQPLDLASSQPFDILDDTQFRLALRIAASGLVGVVWSAPPCKEFSVLKLRRPGPKALRTPSHMDGVPDNSPAEQARVDASTEIHARSR